MIKSKKQMFIVISVVVLIMLLGTVTYAFFNYTRTGSENIVRTGNITFNSSQGTAINLTNAFPLDVSEGIPNDATLVGTVIINVSGSTLYNEGLEYLVTATNVSNTIGSGSSAKTLPISIDVAVASNTNNNPTTTLGTSNNNYFVDRGSTTSYYKVLSHDTISSDDQLLVGYIAPGAAGVDGNIVIRAFIDASKVAISDTYNEENPETDQDGTTSAWVGDRTVFTTEQWNSLQTNGVSFQIKVEANNGIWVEEIIDKNYMVFGNRWHDRIENLDAVVDIVFIRDTRSNIMTRYNNAQYKTDLSFNNGDEVVLEWLEEKNNDNTKYIMYIASDGYTVVYEPASLLSHFPNVETIDLGNLRIETDSDELIAASMFSSCPKLQTVDLSNLNLGDFSKVEMTSMFYNCTQLTQVIFDYSSVINVSAMSRIFEGCSSLITLDLSNFNTANVVSSSAYNAFYGLTNLTTIYVSNNWDFSNQPNYMPIFTGCTSLVGTAPNTTYSFDSSKVDKNMAVIATDETAGYLTDVSLKPTN